MVDTRELLSHIDLRAMAVSAGATFKGPHANSSPCPLHKGNNPTAFHIYRSGDGILRWHCFTGCSRGGDAITFYMMWQGVDFATAVKELEAWSSSPPAIATASTAPAAAERPAPSEMWQERCQDFLRYCQDELWSHEGALAYLAGRGLTSQAIGSWGLGYNPRDVWDNEHPYGLADGKRVWLPQGIVIPGWRDDGLWYVKIRRPLGADMAACGLAPNQPVQLPKLKYANVRGGVQTLFGETHLARRRCLVLVEGEFDTMLLDQVCGNLVDVLTLGGAAGRFTTRDMMLLATYDRILAAHDNDGAGDHARRVVAELSSRVVEWRPWGKDITEMWKADGDDCIRQWVSDALSHVEPAPATATTVVERLDFNRWDEGWQVVT